ncbi:MAG: hypothetical protein JEZ14_14560 [Marinilabiliaceae bacterium]|nr:hypothetical protein [Marinilabiliaceae bacterium]
MRKHPHYPEINVGREGNVIFYEVDGQLLVRSYSPPKNPRTAKQQANRHLHAQLNAISSQTKSLRHFSFQGVRTYKNSHNAFIGLHKQFLYETGLAPEENGVPAVLHWSISNRPGAEWLTIEREEQCILKWDPGRLTRQSDVSNQAVIVIYNVDQKEWWWNLNAAKRTDGQCTVDIPVGWNSDEWITWLFFHDAIHNTSTKDLQIMLPKNSLGVGGKFDSQETIPWALFHEIAHHVIEDREDRK